jgi:hypothetical protein
VTNQQQLQIPTMQQILYLLLPRAKVDQDNNWYYTSCQESSLQ